MTKIIIGYLIIFLLLLLYYSQTRLIDLRLIMYLPAFIFGIFVSVNERQTISTKSMIVAFFVGVLISLIFNTSFIGANWLLSTLLLTISSYFLFNVFRKIFITNIKIKTFIMFLSYSSYCMYLFHRPIYMTLKEIYFPSSHSLQLLYLVVIGLPCIALFAFCLQKFYDITNKMLTRRFQSFQSDTQ